MKDAGPRPPEQIAAHRLLADAAPRGRVVVAERSAHWVPFDEPEIIVPAVQTLVEDARKRG